MSSPRSQSSKDVPFYKNPWFLLAAFAVIAFIGSQAGPPDSTASPAPIMSPAPSLDLPAPLPEPVAPVVEPTPITNNNIIMLGDRDPVPVLDALPTPSPRPRREKPAPQQLAPQPSPEVTKPAIPARQSAVDPDCLPQMVAHHERVAEFYRRMQGK